MSISSLESLHNATRRQLLCRTAGKLLHSLVESIHFELNLTLRRTSAWSPKLHNSVKNDYCERLAASVSSSSMPAAFIERVKRDMRCLEYPARDEVERMINELPVLPRAMVIELASHLSQPTDDYLLLAGYLPDYLRKLLRNSTVSTALRLMGTANLGAVTDTFQFVQLTRRLFERKERTEQDRP